MDGIKIITFTQMFPIPSTGAYNYSQPTETAPQQSIQPAVVASANPPQQYPAGQYAAPQQSYTEPQQQYGYRDTAPQQAVQQSPSAGPQQMASQAPSVAPPMQQQQVPTSAAQAHMYQVCGSMSRHGSTHRD